MTSDYGYQVLRFYVPNSLQNYNHLLHNQHQALICDPFDHQQCLDKLKQHQLQAQAILLTHNHGDHSRAAASLSQALGLPVYAHPESDYPHKFIPLADGQSLPIAPEILAWHCPGHRWDHLCFTNAQHQWLIAGDLIFNAGVGNTRQGDSEQLYQSVMSLVARLPDECLIYPSHDYLLHNLGFSLSIRPQLQRAQELLSAQQSLTPDQRLVSSLALEKEINLFLQCDQSELQTQLAQLGIKAHNALQYFVGLRQLRDKW